MYITNIKHLLDASVKMPEEMPAEARELIGFLKMIIDHTTRTLPQTLTSTGVGCFGKGCEGLIKTAVRPDTTEIHWYCPECEKEGLINNWQGTEWDQSGKNKN
jgi:hypothetical protein